MKTVHKYSLVNGEVYLPKDAIVLHFNFQKQEPFIWALVDPDEEALMYHDYVIRGTGHPVKDKESYIGTAFEGPFVWHLFEVKP